MDISALTGCFSFCIPIEIVIKFIFCIVYPRGTAVAQWLRYCATNRKVAGSIPDSVMEFFIDINPSDRNKALGSTQPPLNNINKT
jgi:hypothetical protein